MDEYNQMTDEDLIETYEFLLAQLSNKAHVDLKDEYARLKSEILRRMSK